MVRGIWDAITAGSLELGINIIDRNRPCQFVPQANLYWPVDWPFQLLKVAEVDQETSGLSYQNVIWAYSAIDSSVAFSRQVVVSEEPGGAYQHLEKNIILILLNAG